MTKQEVEMLRRCAQTPHSHAHVAMCDKALAVGTASFIDDKYWPPAERFGKSRLTEARRTASGEIETQITTLRHGEVIYESDWS